MEIGSSGGDPKLQVSQQRKQQKAFVCRTSGAIELQEGFGRWCAGMVWEWVRVGADGRKNTSGQDGGRRIEKRLPVICVHCGGAVML